MRRPRYRIWMLMIAVAVAALALAGWAANRRIEYRRLLAKKESAYWAAAEGFKANARIWERFIQEMEKVDTPEDTEDTDESGKPEFTFSFERAAKRRWPTGDVEIARGPVSWLQENPKAREEWARRFRAASRYGVAGASHHRAEYIESIRAKILRAKRLVLYDQEMRQKYERAARFPWLAVEPDPPQPPTPF